ncbi:hypothetical protein L484_016191 [Morus notabilis]|uniref:Uncharacterized protein n=1 Tax=Morus notabilis TaxID=981085 RepID=W9RH75_9ROSA|nr:hypothetical protein L484_016191 [Morus notabilis]
MPPYIVCDYYFRPFQDPDTLPPMPSDSGGDNDYHLAFRITMDHLHDDLNEYTTQNSIIVPYGMSSLPRFRPSLSSCFSFSACRYRRTSSTPSQRK